MVVKQFLIFSFQVLHSLIERFDIPAQHFYLSVQGIFAVCGTLAAFVRFRLRVGVEKDGKGVYLQRPAGFEEAGDGSAADGQQRVLHIVARHASGIGGLLPCDVGAAIHDSLQRVGIVFAGLIAVADDAIPATSDRVVLAAGQEEAAHGDVQAVGDGEQVLHGDVVGIVHHAVPCGLVLDGRFDHLAGRQYLLVFQTGYEPGVQSYFIHRHNKNITKSSKIILLISQNCCIFAPKLQHFSQKPNKNGRK